MKKLSVLAVALLLVLVIGCSCTVPLKSFDQVEASQAIIDKEYLRYVEKDASLSAKDKDDRKKLCESNGRNFAAIKKAHE